MKILTTVLLVSGVLNSASNHSVDDVIIRHIIGKWEIRTYGYQFKKDGNYIYLTPMMVLYSRTANGRSRIQGFI
jgi:hypothetical protein